MAQSLALNRQPERHLRKYERWQKVISTGGTPCRVLEETEDVSTAPDDALQFLGRRVKRVHGHQIRDGYVHHFTDCVHYFVNAAGQVLGVDPAQLSDSAVDVTVLLLVVGERGTEEDSII